MQLLENQFGSKNYLDNLIWVKNTTHHDAKTFSHNHEYILSFSKNRDEASSDYMMFRQNKPGYVEVLELVHKLQSSYPSIDLIQKSIRELYKEKTELYKQSVLGQKLEWNDEMKRNDPWKGIKQYKYAEYRLPNGNWVTEEDAEKLEAKIWIYRESDPSWPNASSLTSEHRSSDNADYRFYQPIHPLTNKACSAPARGWLWRKRPNQRKPDTLSFDVLDNQHLISYGEDEKKIPQMKRFLHNVETDVMKSVITDFTDGEKELTHVIGERGTFANPKPTSVIQKLIEISTNEDEIVLDAFVGSGSTAHAIIKQNFADEKHRKFLFVEMGDYFDDTLLKRLKRLICSIDWQAGKPQSDKGISQLFKYLRLESYEDALNNLETSRTRQQKLALDSPDAQGADSFREHYLLHYMLDVETRSSQSLLNVQAFTDPTAYKLKVKRPGSDESGEVNIDLLETFNWLIGLTVQHIAAPQSFSAAFERDSEKRLRLNGRLRQEAGAPWWFRTITGRTPDGRKALIIWRKLTGEPEQDNLVLDEWFRKHAYSTRDTDFDLIYVNGGNNLPNVRRDDETWKVRLIEEDFHRLMFENREGV